MNCSRCNSDIYPYQQIKFKYGCKTHADLTECIFPNSDAVGMISSYVGTAVALMIGTTILDEVSTVVDRQLGNSYKSDQ